MDADRIRRTVETPRPQRSVLTIAEAAVQLDLTARQLRYRIGLGMPTVTRGRKGRTHTTLIDPEAARVWMSEHNKSEAENCRLAAGLIDAVAQSMVLQFRLQSGPHKVALLGSLLDGFYATAGTIRQQLGLPPLQAADVPEVIKQMDKAKCQFDALC